MEELLDKTVRECIPMREAKFKDQDHLRGIEELNKQIKVKHKYILMSTQMEHPT